MNLNDYLEDLTEGVTNSVEQAIKKILKKVEKNVSKEEALANVVSGMSESKKRAEAFLDRVLKVLKREHKWKSPNMLDVSNYIDEYFQD